MTAITNMSAACNFSGARIKGEIQLHYENSVRSQKISWLVYIFRVKNISCLLIKLYKYASLAGKHSLCLEKERHDALLQQKNRDAKNESLKWNCHFQNGTSGPSSWRAHLENLICTTWRQTVAVVVQYDWHWNGCFSFLASRQIVLFHFSKGASEVQLKKQQKKKVPCSSISKVLYCSLISMFSEKNKKYALHVHLCALFVKTAGTVSMTFCHAGKVTAVFHVKVRMCISIPHN